MNNFKEYSIYYNLLYKDKNYFEEARYFDEIIKKYLNKKGNLKLLDLGCGTGNHIRYFSEMNYNVTGIDISEEMLEVASRNIEKAEFILSDIRNFELNRKFDVITSLFHVISYQIENSDVLSVFSRVTRHLEDEGIFIFDCWYGPGVITEKPEVRVKRFENNDYKITRIAEPIIYPKKNTVDVTYNLFVENKIEHSVKEIVETHKMRYFFNTEIELMAEYSGLKVLDSFEFMTNKDCSFKTWNAVFVLCKKEKTF